MALGVELLSVTYLLSQHSLCLGTLARCPILGRGCVSPGLLSEFVLTLCFRAKFLVYSILFVRPVLGHLGFDGGAVLALFDFCFILVISSTDA